MTYQVSPAGAAIRVTYGPGVDFLSKAVVACSGQGKLFFLREADEKAAQVVTQLCRAFSVDQGAYSIDSDVADVPRHLFEARQGGQSVEICMAENGWSELFVHESCSQDEYRPAQLMYIAHAPLAIEVANLVAQGALLIRPSIANIQELSQ